MRKEVALQAPGLSLVWLPARARGQTSLLRNEAQRSGICSLSFLLPPADAFQGKNDCFQRAVSH